jgi:hypothetical protein
VTDQLRMDVDSGTGAVLSPDRVYRYALWRVWDASKPIVLFVGFNPSTADEHVDDPTIRRCIGFAKSWGYGGLVMANVYAYRATDPREVIALERDVAVGPNNDETLRTLAEDCDLVVAAWGTLLRGGRRTLGARSFVDARRERFCSCSAMTSPAWA